MLFSENLPNLKLWWKGYIDGFGNERLALGLYAYIAGHAQGVKDASESAL
jgi:hypothetical protein